MKEFFYLSVISWGFLIVSDISATLNPLTINSLSAFKWWYKPMIHLACKAFITERRREIFTSGDTRPFLSCFKILFAIQGLYFSETYAFGALLMLRSSGWNHEDNISMLKLRCMWRGNYMKVHYLANIFGFCSID